MSAAGFSAADKAKRLEPSWRELWAERAAVREYDGGQARAVAEQGALEDVMRMRCQAGETRVFPWMRGEP